MIGRNWNLAIILIGSEEKVISSAVYEHLISLYEHLISLYEHLISYMNILYPI